MKSEAKPTHIDIIIFDLSILSTSYR